MSRARASHMATWVDLDRLTPSVLRHLAAAKERASRPEYDDTEAMAEELVAHGHGRPATDHRLVPPAPLPSDLPTAFLRSSPRKT